MSPHGHLCRYVDELEMRGKCLELLAGLAIVDSDFEQCVVEPVAICLFKWDCGELLVRWVVWRSNIVRQEPGVSDEMPQANDVIILDMVSEALELLSWNDLPEVVRVVVWVASDLLTLGGNTTVLISQWILVDVRVEVHLSVLVAHRDRIKVVDANGLLCHQVVGKSLLELWSHEIVAWARSREDGKVDLEPEQVHKERNHDQTNDACREVLAKFRQTQGTPFAVDVQQVPQVDQDWHANREEGEGSHVLGADNAAHADTTQEQPLPPLSAKGCMA